MILRYLGLLLCALPLAGEGQAEAGRWRFRIYCAPCHGIRGDGGRAPDLTTGIYTAGEKDADLFRVIADGVPGTEMNGYHDRFEDDGVNDLVAYIRSISRKTPPPGGDAQAGSKLYWGKGGCPACHMIAGRGGRTGPNLTRVGRSRNYENLKTSVINPNAEIVSGFATIAVTMQDGKKLTGVQRNYDNFTVQFMDSSEKIHSFDRANLSSAERIWKSTMPEMYAKLFTDSELKDLLAYLSSLRKDTAQ